MYRLLLSTAILLVLISGCKGVITGRDYNTEEIAKISKFLSVSKDRLEAYKNGDITIEELGVSADRLRQAVEYVKNEE